MARDIVRNDDRDYAALEQYSDALTQLLALDTVEDFSDDDDFPDSQRGDRTT
ncbi:hypothetical protein H7I76_01200 [Mycolicibacterium vaccae]|nr:hypothetical protein [Mycolicibacterium vaccae]